MSSIYLTIQNWILIKLKSSSACVEIKLTEGEVKCRILSACSFRYQIQGGYKSLPEDYLVSILWELRPLYFVSKRQNIKLVIGVGNSWVNRQFLYLIWMNKSS